MVADTSAVVAILQAEPERRPMLAAIKNDERRLISAITLVEATMVLEGRFGADSGGDVDLFIHDAGFEVIPFDARQASVARRAWRKYGKGRHPARLNLGDCCTYALAKTTGEPLLAKGNDFPQTDLELVSLQPSA